MATKSYDDKITTNFHEISSEQQSKLRAIWNEYAPRPAHVAVNETPPHNVSEHNMSAQTSASSTVLSISK